VQSVSEVTQRGDAQGPGGRSSDGIYQGWVLTCSLHGEQVNVGTQ
jgi:hypothetical protein